MLNFRGKIPYVEYTSKDLLSVKGIIDSKNKADIRDYSVISSGDLDVSRFRLSTAIAKSLYAKEPSKTIKRQLAYSYFIQLPLILTAINNYIYIDYNNMELFRDFSKSCRDGEIAQGISYILATDVMHVSAVEDFKYYCYGRKNFVPKCTHKTPDYIFTKNNGSIGLLEAKGLMDADPTHSMTYGMDQCLNGEDYLKNNGIIPANKYVSVVTFATSKNRRRKTTISFSDPPSDSATGYSTPENVQGSTYREYAKFLYMAGDDKLDNMVQEDKMQPESNLFRYQNYFSHLYNNPNYHKLYKEDKTDITYEMISVVKKKYAPIFDDKEYEVEFGITEKATEYISKEFQTFYNTGSVYGTFNQEAGEFEIFPDGTYMSILQIR